MNKDNEKVDFLTAWDDLTPKEKEIFRWLIEGLTDQQIAEKLYLSQRTITTHVYHILKKFGIKARTKLVVFYYRDSGFSVVENQNRVEICRQTLSAKEG